MTTADLIRERVHEYYWEHDFNCAVTMLKILAEINGVALAPQVLAAATGMHGAGGNGAQCGLVEGAMMFVGIWGKEKGYSKDEIGEACRDFALAFIREFGSLDCRVRRPEGFKPENPPHLCEPLSVRAVMFATDFAAGIN